MDVLLAVIAAQIFAARERMYCLECRALQRSIPAPGMNRILILGSRTTSAGGAGRRTAD